METGRLASARFVMIKLTFFSDTHLGFDLPVNPRVSLRRRGEDFFENTKTVFEQAIASRSDLIIHGGDLFFRSKVPAVIVDKAYALLFEYAEAGIPIIIVPGNHERSVLPQSILLNHPNLYVFRQPERFQFEIKGERVSVSGFPNIRNGARAQFSGIQRKIQPKPGVLNILLMHQAIDGSRAEGYVFHDDADTVDITQINKNYHLVLSGHIHRRQILTNGRQPVIFAGSVERTSFQEMYEPKGYYEVRMIKNIKKWLPQIKFIELRTRPMVNLFLDDIINDDDWEEKLRKAISPLAKDSIVRLNLRQRDISPQSTRLTTDRLKKIFPATMNYTLSKSIFNLI